MSARNTCRIVEGRLMEIDVAAGYTTVSDVDAMIAMISATLATVPSHRMVVIAADWRPCAVFTPVVADRALQMLQGANPRVERSAILHRADQAISVLQVFRLVRESANDQRRIFRDTETLRTWLAAVLNERERTRLQAFLAQR